MSPEKEFLMNFHNLEGFTLGEKRKNYFLLLNKFKLADPNTVNALVSSLTPKDHLESVFRVELLIFFQRSSELFDVLKAGNEELSSKIFRQPWFFQTPFDHLTAEEIVDDLFCYLSFVTRNRLIKSLAKYHKNEEKVDKIFDLLNDKYGIHSAKLIIRGCSDNKIRQILKSHNLVLTSTDLVPMFNKNPHLLEVFRTLVSLNFCEDPQLGREVVSKETEMFFTHWELFSNVDLGKRGTKKLLRYNKEKIITNFKDHYRNLHLRTVYKFLRKQDATALIEKMYPEQPSYFSYHHIKDFMKFFPKDERFRLCSDAYQNVYKKTIWEESDAISDDLFKEMVSSEDKEKWISIKMKTASDPDNYYQYMDINKAMSFIKEKLIVITGIEPRAKLLNSLVLACKYNEDLEALKDVLYYFCTNFLTSKVTFTIRFLDTLVANYTLADLSAGHWRYINRILEDKSEIRKDFSYYKRQVILLQYILHLWKNKLSCEKKIVELIQNDDFQVKHYEFIRTINCEEVERIWIAKMIELLPDKVKDDLALCEQYFDCFMWIAKFNATSKNPILVSSFPLLINWVKKYIDEYVTTRGYNYGVESVFSSYICKKDKDDFEQYLTNAYFEKVYARYTCESIIIWYLQNDPALLTKYADKVAGSVCNGYIFNWKLWFYIKRMSYLSIYDKAIEFCLENYMNDSADLRIRILAYLMYPDDYLNVVSKHVPTAERMDIDDDNSKANYNIQIAVAASFKYTKSFTVLPTLIGFCVGDYLRNALESLYYLFYHSPEMKLGTFVMELSDRAVSVRKHALFLTSQVGTMQAVFELLKRSAENEKNSSMRKHLLDTAFKCFTKNPSEKLFELLLSCIPSMSGVDSESIKTIGSISAVPDKYQGKYFIFVLDYLTSLAKEHDSVGIEANQFLSNINDNIMKQLSYSYCLAFIDEHFLQTNHIYKEDSVMGFVNKFLNFCDYDFSEKVNYMLYKLISYEGCTVDVMKKIETSKKVHAILSYFVIEFKYNYTVEKLRIFYNKMFQHFDTEEYFPHYIDFNILIMEKESDDDASMFSKKINSFVQEIATKYSSDLIGYLAKRINYFLPYKVEIDIYVHQLCSELWKISKSVDNTILILKLLPNRPPVNEENRDKYYKMLEAIESDPNVLLKETFNTYVRSLSIV